MEKSTKYLNIYMLSHSLSHLYRVIALFYDCCCIMVPHSPRAFEQDDLHVWADVGVAKTTNPRVPCRRKHCGGSIERWGEEPCLAVSVHP